MNICSGLWGDHEESTSLTRQQAARRISPRFYSMGRSIWEVFWRLLSLCSPKPGSHPAMLERVVLNQAQPPTWFTMHTLWLCVFEHGVTELLTADRDFTRFSGLKINNPFIP